VFTRDVKILTRRCGGICTKESTNTLQIDLASTNIAIKACPKICRGGLTSSRMCGFSLLHERRDNLFDGLLNNMEAVVVIFSEHIGAHKSE
jgi:hypothetical protein